MKQAAVRDFNAAAALQNNGLYTRAAQRWSDFVRKYPSDERLDRVHYYLGICHLHAKNPVEAAKAFETVLSRWPNFGQADGAAYNLGMAYHQLALASNKPEDFQKAADALSKVPAQSSHAHKAVYYRGDSLYSAGQPEKAADAYKKLTTDFATSPLLGDALYALGTTQQELERPDDAVATFERFLSEASLQKHELTDEIRLRLGMVLFTLEKFQEAEPHFDAVAKLQDFPHADFALLRQAQCRLENEKTAEAATLFVDLTKKHPTSSYLKTAQLAAGKCLYLTGKLDEAQQQLQPLGGGDGDEAAEAAYWLGRTLLKLNKPTDAFSVLDQAVAKFKTGEFAPYLVVARIDAMYEMPERRAETAALYKRFIEQYPDHPLAPQATYLAALAALGAEQFDPARQYAETFLSKNPDHELTPAVLYIAAEAYLLPVERDAAGGDANKAEQLYRQLVQKYPDHARAARSHLRIGWCLHRAKKYDDAVNYLRGALSRLKEPEHVAEAQLLIGGSASAGGKHPEALQAYDAALAAKGDWLRADEVLIGAAQSHRETNNPDAAADRLRKLVDSYADSEFRGQALYQLGEIAQEKDGRDEAIQRFKEVVEKHADGKFAAAARYGLASAYFAKEQYDEAKAALDALLSSEAEPEISARGRYLRGLVAQRKKEFSAAVEDLEQFLNESPDEGSESGARYALALCRIGLKQYEQAAQEITVLLQKKPEFALADKAYYELGHALAEQNKAEDSAKAFRTLAETFPKSTLAAECWFHVGRYHEQKSESTDDKDAKSTELAAAADAFSQGVPLAKEADLKEKLQYKLGDMRFRQGDFAEASKVLLAQTNEHANGELVGPARYLAAESLLRLEDYRQAKPLFEQVVNAKVEEYLAEALFGAGKCAAAIDDWPSSEKHFSALVSQHADFPQIAEARYGHAVALHKQNRLAEALPLYEQVTKETETEVAAKARFMIGEIAFAQKKYEDAVVNYLEVAVGYPYKEWQAMAQYETGRCFIELGDKAKAIAALQVVVEKHPDHPQAENAKKLIAELQK
jgi:TolA-binding protein